MERVLHVVTTLDTGGAESHLLALAGGQAARGLTVDIAYLRGDPAREQAFALRGVRALRVGPGRRRPGPLALVSLVRLLARGRYDVLHAHLVEAELLTALALLVAPGRRFVVTKHNDDPFWHRAPVRQIARWVARRADRVIGISEHVARAFVQLGLPAATMRAVHYGLDPASPGDRAAARAALGLPPDAPVVGTVGRLVPQKGHDLLVAALAHLPPDVHLAIIGEGERRDALLQQARTLGLDDRVHLAGWRPDAAALMAAFDLFALPSRWEGFGLVLLEAMAQSLPVVASRVSAIPEIVIDGETGRMVPPDDVPALAVALSHVLASPGRLGANGRRRLEQCFTVDRMVDATLAAYA